MPAALKSSSSSAPSPPPSAPAHDFPQPRDIETLAAIGQLASKVAHELNNPLDGIIRYISLSQRKIKEGRLDGVERYLSAAQFGLQRMAEVLRELLDLNRPAPPPNAPVRALPPLHYVLEQSIQALEPLAQAHHVAIECRLGTPNSLTVPANLFGVFTNLLKNALDAMPAGGQILVSSTLEPSPSDPRQLVIRIRDSGPGIPQEDLPHIFEPFFSRKPPTTEAPGTGLGLAITKEILERIGALISVENLAPQTGCQFTLRIPLKETKPGASACRGQCSES